MIDIHIAGVAKSSLIDAYTNLRTLVTSTRTTMGSLSMKDAKRDRLDSH